MRLCAVALISFAAAAAMSHAQQPTAPHVTVAPTVVIVGAGCPGQLLAQQQATGGATIWTTAQGDARNITAQPSGLGIHVEFNGLNTPIKNLELRVSYLPVGLHRMDVTPALANTTAAGPAERHKEFNLEREAAMHINADLFVGPAATITRVHLISATFADGTVWHAPTETACTVVPNRTMLVANR